MVILVLQPCVTFLCTDSCTKTRELIHGSPLGKDKVNPHRSAYLFLLLFPSQYPHLSLFSPPPLALSENGAICPQQCSQFNLIQPCRSARAQTIVETGCRSCQSAVQTPELISLVSAFLCCLTDIDHLGQDRNTCCCLYAAQCLSLSSILYFCSSPILYVHSSSFSISGKSDLKEARLWSWSPWFNFIHLRQT